MKWWSPNFWQRPESFVELRDLDAAEAAEHYRQARRAIWKRPPMIVGFAVILATTVVPFLLSIPMTSGLRLRATIISSVAPLPAVGVIIWWQRQLIRRELWRRLNNRCDDCGYNVTANKSGTCPECGAMIG